MYVRSTPRKLDKYTSVPEILCGDGSIIPWQTARRKYHDPNDDNAKERTTNETTVKSWLNWFCEKIK